MKKTTRCFFIALTLCLLVGCNMITNLFTYKGITREFVESLLKEDYDASKEYLVIEDYANEGISSDSLKVLLSTFRQYTVDRFGTELNYTFLNAQKKISTIESQNTPSGMTEVMIEISNEKDFGLIQALFVDDTHKIAKINVLNTKVPIPSMGWFWLVGLLAICVPIFNIYIIIKIKRSSLTKKWIKYIAVIALNIPTLMYSAVAGFSFKLLHFQLLGVGFSLMGYTNSYWAFSIPVGAIYWFWCLSEREDEVQPVNSDTYPSYGENNGKTKLE